MRFVAGRDAVEKRLVRGVVAEGQAAAARRPWQEGRGKKAVASKKKPAVASKKSPP